MMAADAFTDFFAWGETAAPGVSVAPAVAEPATFLATPETAPIQQLRDDPEPTVAGVATVADWREGVALFDKMPCPSIMDPGAWRILQSDVMQFARLWAADAEKLGWTVIDMFGMNPDPRHRRLDRLGIVPLLGGRQITAIDAETADIAERVGPSMTFRRGKGALGSVPLWAAQWEPAA